MPRRRGSCTCVSTVVVALRVYIICAMTCLPQAAYTPAASVPTSGAARKVRGSGSASCCSSERRGKLGASDRGGSEESRLQDELKAAHEKIAGWREEAAAVRRDAVFEDAAALAMAKAELAAAEMALAAMQARPLQTTQH
eukprot:SAG11_NODE_2769_length_2993_cov_3.920180_3_plen_140_part_00